MPIQVRPGSDRPASLLGRCHNRRLPQMNPFSLQWEQIGFSPGLASSNIRPPNGEQARLGGLSSAPQPSTSAFRCYFCPENDGVSRAAAPSTRGSVPAICTFRFRSCTTALPKPKTLE